MAGEESAQMRVERERPHVDAVESQSDVRRNHFGLNAREPAKKAVLLLRPEALDARNHSNFMPSGGQRFHEQPVRFVSASVRGIVERIVRQQYPHYFEERSRRRCARSARLAGERLGGPVCLGGGSSRSMSSN